MRPNFSAKNEGIIGLIAVFTVGIFGLGAVLTMANGAFAGLSKNRHASSGNDVFYAAESAMREGAYQYVGALSYAGGDSPLLNGVLSNTVEVYAPPEQWPYVTVKGVSSNEQTNRKAVHTITVFPEGEAFEYGIFAENDLSVGGNTEVNGSIFANSNIDFTGNSAEINGNAYSPNEISDTDNINGDAVSGVNHIPPPVLKLGPYQDIAEAAGTYFMDSNDAENYLNNEAREAVIFVDDSGTTKIQGSNTSLTGALAVNGDLEISGGTFSASGSYAAVVVNGNLKISGGVVINGVVYVFGSTSFGAGNNVINGALIAVGDVNVTDVSGNTTINYDPDLAINWKDLTGLNTESVEEPKVILWGEE